MSDHAAYMREYRKNNYERERVRLNLSNRRSKAKKRAIVLAAKAKPCADCKIQYPSYVMDFDHRYDKKFDISRYYAHPMIDVLAEIEKCDVVCANCHRERTWGA